MTVKANTKVFHGGIFKEVKTTHSSRFAEQEKLRLKNAGKAVRIKKYGNEFCIYAR